MKFYGTATIGAKGQVVIPAEAREEYELSNTDKLLVFSAPSHKGLVLVKADSLDGLMEQMEKHLSNMKTVAEDISEAAESEK